MTQQASCRHDIIVMAADHVVVRALVVVLVGWWLGCASLSSSC